MGNELKGQLGELRMTIHVTRAATGKTETHELIGRVMRESEEPQGGENLSNSQHSGS